MCYHEEWEQLSMEKWPEGQRNVDRIVFGEHTI